MDVELVWRPWFAMAISKWWVVPRPRRQNQPGSWAGGLVWPMQFGNSVPVTILLGLLEVWGTGQFVCSRSPLFQDGLDTQQREREFLISLHLCHRQRFCLPCAAGRTGAGWGHLPYSACAKWPGLAPRWDKWPAPSGKHCHMKTSNRGHSLV